MALYIPDIMIEFPSQHGHIYQICVTTTPSPSAKVCSTDSYKNAQWS